MTQREQFDAWMKERFADSDTTGFAPVMFVAWQASRREALEEASALCQAIANGFVSDANPNRSRKAADAAKFCAREIAALSQKVGDQQ